MSRHTEQGAEREITSLLGVLNRLSDELGVSMAVLSLSWAMRQSGVANTLVGSRNAKQFLENLSAAEYRIPDDAYETLCAASQPVWDILGDNPDYYQNREDSRVW